ncbi:MAG: hypothetical protein AAF203_01130 [Pseudomonadota bacterium]
MKNGILLTILIAVGLLGCKEVKVENGEVPEKYLDQVDPYLGVYSGQFNGLKGDLEISMDGQKALLKFTDFNGKSDILGQNCQSEIGLLKAFQAKKIDDDQYELRGARFEFFSNYCFLEGREIRLSFKGDRLRAEILEEIERIPGRPRPPQCTKHGCTGGGKEPDKFIYHYLKGQFNKN